MPAHDTWPEHGFHWTGTELPIQKYKVKELVLSTVLPQVGKLFSQVRIKDFLQAKGKRAFYYLIIHVRYNCSAKSLCFIPTQ